MADPDTVLGLATGLASLQVASVPTSGSEPTTPVDSPLSLEAGLRRWLNTTAAGSNNPKVYAKLLVSNAAAGSVIGKAGGNINDVQARTYARIQLSKANEYFPGTTERTLLVTGRLKPMVAAFSLILSKLLREGVAPLSPKSKAAAAVQHASRASGIDTSVGQPEEAAEDAGSLAPMRLLVRLLVPQPLCGVIIGKNGATIRGYAADTGTIIRVTSGEASQVPSSHRIVTIAGEKEGVLKAIALMVLKQSDDPKFPLYGELPSPALLPSSMLSYGVPAGSMPMAMGPPYQPGVLPYMAAGVAGSAAGSMPAFGRPPSSSSGLAPQGDGFVPVSLIVTEDQAGVLLEQGSRAVVEVEQATGCRVQLDIVDSQRGSFGRLLLLGPPDAVGYAQWLLGQRLAVAAAASYQMGGTTYYSGTYAGGLVPPSFAGPAPPSLAFVAAPWQLPRGLVQEQAAMPTSAAGKSGAPPCPDYPTDYYQAHAVW